MVGQVDAKKWVWVDLPPTMTDWCQHVMQAHGRTGGTAQEWVRGMLGCVGRGGNAQAIRDEILHIMHRHHIGEKHGTWMEVTQVVQQHISNSVVEQCRQC